MLRRSPERHRQPAGAKRGNRKNRILDYPSASRRHLANAEMSAPRMARNIAHMDVLAAVLHWQDGIGGSRGKRRCWFAVSTLGPRRIGTALRATQMYSLRQIRFWV